MAEDQKLYRYIGTEEPFTLEGHPTPRLHRGDSIALNAEEAEKHKGIFIPFGGDVAEQPEV